MSNKIPVFSSFILLCVLGVRDFRIAKTECAPSERSRARVMKRVGMVRGMRIACSLLRYAAKIRIVASNVASDGTGRGIRRKRDHLSIV
jgi:hypothetical protein